MSLQEIVESSNKPYGSPKIKVFIIAEDSREKVLKWDTTKSPPIPLPGSIKINKAIAITDGKTVSLSTLFEDVKDKLNEGHYYNIVNYGIWKHKLDIRARAKIVKAAPFPVTPALVKEGKELLAPPEQMYKPEEEANEGLYNVKGLVIKASKAQLEPKTGAPVREILLDQGGNILKITLWREQTLKNLEKGQYVQITYLKVCGEKALRSSSLTKITEETSREILVEGTTEVAEGGLFEILSEDGEIYTVPEEIWHLKDANNIRVKAEVVNQTIKSYVLIDDTEL